MNKFFCPFLEKFCPLFEHFAQMGSGVPRWGLFLPTCKFRPCWQCVTLSLCPCKLLYTATFQWGLTVATHCCVTVHQCFIQDQPDTTEISQIQLAPAVTWPGGRLSGYWGQTACRAQCTFLLSWNTNPVNAAAIFLISKSLLLGWLLACCHAWL